ncbi:MAG: hypothetical protein RMA76_28835 [Deltaproteobacteria bacterium]|jgi:hypothetical protein
MNASSSRPPKPSLEVGDPVRVRGELRTIAREPFWLDDMQRWRVLTNNPDRTQQFVDCDVLVLLAQLSLFGEQEETTDA